VNNNIFLRNLRQIDINKNYLNWFKDDQILKYIHSSKKILKIEDLKKYYLEKKKEKKILFLAILNFQRKHIGNIKFEPLKSNPKKIYMGIMIGDKKYINKGVSKIVFKKVKNKFLKKFKIKKYYARVNNLNKIAINAYLKNNFKIVNKMKKDIELVKYL
tara:strand:+ start:467 stop:943 length:477 start_codon:yes stop_codon:yes gene_type:complete